MRSESNFTSIYGSMTGTCQLQCYSVLPRELRAEIFVINLSKRVPRELSEIASRSLLKFDTAKAILPRARARAPKRRWDVCKGRGRNTFRNMRIIRPPLEADSIMCHPIANSEMRAVLAYRSNTSIGNTATGWNPTTNVET